MIHICIGLYKNADYYAKYAGTLMVSIFENLTAPYPSIMFHILHNNTLTDSNRDKFCNLAGRYNQQVKFYNIEQLCSNKDGGLSATLSELSFNILDFYRLLITKFLPSNVGKVIYLDSGVVVNLDIREIWRIELGDKPVAAILESLNGVKETHFRLCLEGILKAGCYLNVGVILMNLDILRSEEETTISAIKFIGKKYGHGDQDVLNYCFAERALKLPVKFNQFVGAIPRRNDSKPDKKIYQYLGSVLQLDMEDPFNRLWMEYFSKTPWFDIEVMGNLYTSFQKIYNDLKDCAVEISKVSRQKSRVFFVEPANVALVSEVFSVRNDEEIIAAEDASSLQRLIDTMKAYKGKCLFFIMTERFLKKEFPFEQLTKAGFVERTDFLKGWTLLPEIHGGRFDHRSLIVKM